MNTLLPNFFRLTVKMLLLMTALSIVTYFIQGYSQNHWWTRDYIFSLAIPFILVPLAIWFMFIPRSISYDHDSFYIQKWFCHELRYSWDDLTHYGQGSGVFLLQFGSSQALQISGIAFKATEWKAFKTFVQVRAPNEPAFFWLGPFGFGGKKKP